MEAHIPLTHTFENSVFNLPHTSHSHICSPLYTADPELPGCLPKPPLLAGAAGFGACPHLGGGGPSRTAHLHGAEAGAGSGAQSGRREPRRGQSASQNASDASGGSQVVP